MKMIKATHDKYERAKNMKKTSPFLVNGEAFQMIDLKCIPWKMVIIERQ